MFAFQNVSCCRFTGVTLSSAVKVQDRRKGSIAVCKYKVSCCKHLVMLARYPPAQVCLPVVERPEEAALRMRLSIPPLGMLLTAPASGLRGLSLPDLTLLVVWGEKGWAERLLAADRSCHG
ncbi:uncharacterized protein LJ206_019714 isoform 1-T1 [Theristicus caerulescens]